MITLMAWALLASDPLPAFFVPVFYADQHTSRLMGVVLRGSMIRPHRPDRPAPPAIPLRVVMDGAGRLQGVVVAELIVSPRGRPSLLHKGRTTRRAGRLISYSVKGHGGTLSYDGAALSSLQRRAKDGSMGTFEFSYDGKGRLCGLRYHLARSTYSVELEMTYSRGFTLRSVSCLFHHGVGERWSFNRAGRRLSVLTLEKMGRGRRSRGGGMEWHLGYARSRLVRLVRYENVPSGCGSRHRTQMRAVAGTSLKGGSPTSWGRWRPRLRLVTSRWQMFY